MTSDDATVWGGEVGDAIYASGLAYARVYYELNPETGKSEFVGHERMIQLLEEYPALRDEFGKDSYEYGWPGKQRFSRMWTVSVCKSAISVRHCCKLMAFFLSTVCRIAEDSLQRCCKKFTYLLQKICSGTAHILQRKCADS